MKNLRKYIRKIIVEGMNTHDMLPPNIGIKIEERGGYSASIDIMYCDLKTGANYVFLQPSEEGVYGSITIAPLNPYEPNYDWRETWKNTKYGDDYIRNLDCDGAYRIVLSAAAKGWGPLLYDVAIEMATMKGSGLVADRSGVTKDAQSVWKKYMYTRGDVEKFQCDDQYNTLTKTLEDNMDMEIPDAEEYTYNPKDLKSNPLGKRYSRPPTTIKELGSLGKLILGE